MPVVKPEHLMFSLLYFCQKPQFRPYKDWASLDPLPATYDLRKSASIDSFTDSLVYLSMQFVFMMVILHFI